jgi:DNA-binding transcriptional regulator YiaG
MEVCMDVRTVVNETLDRIQQRERLNDQALARRLNVDPATIWRWRKGGLGKAAITLIPLLLNEHQGDSERTG